MTDRDPFENAKGIERTIMFLAAALEDSEAAAVTNGTNYVEAEELIAKAIRDTAEDFGGDITDPQFYCGVMVSLTLFIGMSNDERNPLSRLVHNSFIAPILSGLSMGIGRTFQSVMEGGANVFGGE